MRVLRVLALALVLALAYFAQYLFDHGSLATFFPTWLLDRVPYFAQMGLWLAEDLHTLGIWLFALTALGFGLLAPPWVDAAGDGPGENHRPPDTAAPVRSEGDRTSRWLAIGGAAVAVVCGLLLGLGVDETIWLELLWAGAVLLFVAGTILAGRATIAGNAGAAASTATADVDWSEWAAVFAGAALLLAWGWTTLPVRIDAAAARMGIYATGAYAGTLFTPGATGAPGLAYLPMAVAIRLAGDALTGAHIVGLLAGLVTVLATWLVGTELFRHVDPVKGSVGGRGMALVAAALVGVNIAILHFGRMAPYLPATAVGLAGSWALLRGMRTCSRPALGAGGLLAGLALLLDRSGILFPLVALAWWGGSWLLARPRAGHAGAGKVGFLWWVGGFVVATAPVLGYWLGHPAAWQAYWHGALLYGEVPEAWPMVDLWANLRQTITTFFWTADAGRAFGFSGHLLDSLTAPLFVLATGALVFNLDRLVGWRLLTWLVLGVGITSLASATAPDWAMMLPLVPAAALAISFALDRIRMLWVAPEPEENVSGIAVLAGGLIVAAGLMSWIGYFPFAHNGGDAASYVGRGLRAIEPAAAAVLVSAATTPAVDLNDPVVRFASNGRSVDGAATTAYALGAMPAVLEPGTVVMFLPADQGIVPELRSRYPGGALEVLRDLQANPRLYLYRLP